MNCSLIHPAPAQRQPATPNFSLFFVLEFYLVITSAKPGKAVTKIMSDEDREYTEEEIKVKIHKPNVLH